jgi:hypothetical protein
MSTFNGEPEANARAEQVQFENKKNRTKDSYKYKDKDKKDKKVDGLARRRTKTEAVRHKRDISNAGR